ncbi:MAG TPA: vWA domain-containing protein [Polyangiaceae bacterium]|nr:vWA domain-containing protein [Polyangiaceae bacterium]
MTLRNSLVWRRCARPIETGSVALASVAALGFSMALGLSTLSACSDSNQEREPEDVNAPPVLDDRDNSGAIFDGEMMGSGTSSGFDATQACVGQQAGTELAPAIVELLVDTSLSMDEQAPGSRRSKWLETRDVVLEGINLMPSTTSVGVVFYPDVEVGADPCFDGEADIEIDSLGGMGSTQRSQILEAFRDEEPRGSTPTHDAYRYALSQVSASTNPGQRFLVLITDGTPTYALGCRGSGQQQDPADPTPLIPEAASALARGIKTFVIGSPGSEGARRSLSQMAEAGGTASQGCSHDGPIFCHFDMTERPDFTTSLRDALASISGLALSCAYDIPPPPNGSTLDPSKVNVLFTPQGGEREVIGQSPNGSCTDGWQYSGNQSQILLCGDTCDRVKASAGQVSLEFGCTTRVIF